MTDPSLQSKSSDMNTQHGITSEIRKVYRDHRHMGVVERGIAGYRRCEVGEGKTRQSLQLGKREGEQ